MNEQFALFSSLAFPSGAAVAEWVAAIATGCLVLAGLIQLKAIRKGAEEQRARWKREDEKFLAIHAKVGFVAKTQHPRGYFYPSVQARVANFGLSTIVVSQIFLQGSPQIKSKPNIEIAPGNHEFIPIDGAMLLPNDHEVGDTTTKPFCVVLTIENALKEKQVIFTNIEVVFRNRDNTPQQVTFHNVG
ncbi:MAG: hypothetical protein ACYDC6_10595 [Acidobacteriaceae bacterium]